MEIKTPQVARAVVQTDCWLTEEWRKILEMVIEEWEEQIKEREDPLPEV